MLCSAALVILKHQLTFQHLALITPDEKYVKLYQDSKNGIIEFKTLLSRIMAILTTLFWTIALYFQ